MAHLVCGLVAVPGAISPTFDLESLSCNLKVSVDRRTVTVSDFLMLYAWSPERFDSSQALCSQALSSGQHYWEVDTQRCSHWAVGVASRGMKRDQILGRTTDSWCVEWKGTNPPAPLSLGFSRQEYWSVLPLPSPGDTETQVQ